MSIESVKSIIEEGLMADVRRAGCEEEFFSINSGANPEGQLVDVADHCRHLPLRLRLRLPVQWLNECLNKADWKYLRQRGQGLHSFYNTMACFYQAIS